MLADSGFPSPELALGGCDVKFDQKNPPRVFEVGNTVRFAMRDCGTVSLEPDEQLTFIRPSGAEFDVSAKDWGFYATPSLNGRLAGFGLRGALIRNRTTGRYFVLIVESGYEPAFEAYLAQETCEVVVWLDSTDSLDHIRQSVGHNPKAPIEAASIRPTLDCPCGEQSHRCTTFTYREPPPGETRFELAGTYARRYDACSLCGHWFGVHSIDLSRLYDRDYVDATYGGPEGMRARFERIMALPEAHSDNRQRVARIETYIAAAGGAGRRLLDVGAGLGVFPAAMAAKGWAAIGLEPDQRTVEHLRGVAGIEALAANLFDLRPAETGTFDLISFNKVLEHVENPVAMLGHARSLLAPEGLIYVEVPDTAAAVEGPGREEFFLEHHHVFSPASLTLLCERAGLEVTSLERLREPSGKFTLYAFAHLASLPDRAGHPAKSQNPR